jgi:hypothetical protein
MEAQNSGAVCQLDDARSEGAKKPARGGLFAKRPDSAAAAPQQGGTGQARAEQRQRARLRHLGGADFVDVADAARQQVQPEAPGAEGLVADDRLVGKAGLVAEQGIVVAVAMLAERHHIPAGPAEGPVERGIEGMHRAVAIGQRRIVVTGEESAAVEQAHLVVEARDEAIAIQVAGRLVHEGIEQQAGAGADGKGHARDLRLLRLAVAIAVDGENRAVDDGGMAGAAQGECARRQQGAEKCAHIDLILGLGGSSSKFCAATYDCLQIKGLALTWAKPRNQV